MRLITTNPEQQSSGKADPVEKWVPVAVEDPPSGHLVLVQTSEGHVCAGRWMASEHRWSRAASYKLWSEPVFWSPIPLVGP